MRFKHPVDLPKSIMIRPKNAVAIERALEHVNGRATQHAFVSYQEIAGLVVHAERKLESAGIAKSHWPGVRYVAESGHVLPNSYRNSVRTTTVWLIYRPTGWALKTVVQSTLWPAQKPLERLELSPDQDEIAVRKFREAHYTVRDMRFDEVVARNANAQFIRRDDFSETMIYWLDTHAEEGQWAKCRVDGGTHGEGYAITFEDDNVAFAFKMRWHKPV